MERTIINVRLAAVKVYHPMTRSSARQTKVHSNNRCMFRWISGTKDRDEIPWTSLFQKLDIEDVTTGFHRQWLRWPGYIHRVTLCIESVTDLKIFKDSRLDGEDGPERYISSECEKNDVKRMWPVWRWSSIQRRMEGQCSALPGDSKPNRMGHRHQPNLKWIWIDSWMDVMVYVWKCTPNNSQKFVNHELVADPLSYNLRLLIAMHRAFKCIFIQVNMDSRGNFINQIN